MPGVGCCLPQTFAKLLHEMDFYKFGPVRGNSSILSQQEAGLIAPPAMSTTRNVFAPSCSGQSARLSIAIPEGPGGLEDGSEMHYPPEAVQIRNTFIHIASPAAPDDAYRPALSCPASQVGLIQRTMKDWQDDATEAKVKPVICLEDALCGGTDGWTAEPAVDIQAGWQCPIQTGNWSRQYPLRLSWHREHRNFPASDPVDTTQATASHALFCMLHRAAEMVPCARFVTCVTKVEKKRRQKLMRAALNKCQAD